MDKRKEFNDALKDAMKNGDKVSVSTIRLILAALKDRDITSRENGQADGVNDSDIMNMLQSMIKQRQESAATYSDAGRCDLAEREEAEIDVIRQFMPKQLNDEEVRALIADTIEKTEAENIRDMGKVMAVLKTEYAGQLDMGKAGRIAKELLG